MTDTEASAAIQDDTLEDDALDSRLCGKFSWEKCMSGR